MHMGLDSKREGGGGEHWTARVRYCCCLLPSTHKIEVHKRPSEEEEEGI